MSPRSLAGLLPLAVALAGGSGTAHADIYTWVDPNGVVTYSDAPPPKGARLVNVVREAPAKATTAADLAASREAAHQAEVRALAERIRLLEQQVDLASRAAPPPTQYVNTAPPPAPCDPSWSDCGYGWSTPFLTTPVVIIRQPHFHRFGNERRFVNHSGIHHQGMRTIR